MFKAITVKKDESGYEAVLADLNEDELPEGNVLVKVHYSTLNYKDALAVTGKAPVVRRFPMVPGIDLVGVVEQSSDPLFPVGSEVVLNGWGVGEEHWGGLAQKARLKGDWLISLPHGITPSQAMAIGTAGYTAMLCVSALERHGLRPEQGEVLVTGANGGVGSFAITILSSLGYTVVAATGRPEQEEYLKGLGASSIVDRNDLSSPGRPLQRERWAAAVDSVGSHTLANVCAATKENGLVAACGMAQGLDFPASVAPFILRGVTLLGINSVTRPRHERVAAWDRLAQCLDFAKFESLSREISLAEAIPAAADLIDGKVRGRLIVDVNR